ncbi:hypothetical protein Mycsm_04030 [Mycobacterium sp. JS623]|uniref:hypothetical protein n=1 Tax=Mycobacterium sp. JS623 TaxID=212767 RepID=UPI0002A55BB2|nr:hypothetical protein [Mycobacterium sp. JS623]AGB24287.1 hypothetical protein Mycsm_04030 [Mycobacterium sp. JS623]
MRLEARLPDLTTTFERWALVDTERKDADLEERELAARLRPLLAEMADRPST